MNEFLNTEVRIYPGDTELKCGIVLEILEHGVVFKITRSNSINYKVGTLRYIAFSASLSFASL